MTKANECTCPSGDGSLAHPCPAHPAPVEQAGGDERAVDGKPRATRCPDCGESDLMPGDLCTCGYETDPAAGYACSECDGSGDGYVGEVCRECDGSGWFVTPEQARAALAQPSPAQARSTWPKLEKPAQVGAVRFSAGMSSRLVVEAAQRLYEFESTPEKEAERIERLQAFREQCFEPLGTEFSKVLSDNLPELLSTAQAEHAEAEAERPEAVGYLLAKGNGTLSILRAGPSDEPVMTVAQHDRIVDALRFERQQMDRAFTACINERDSLAKRWDEAVRYGARIEEQRDAALARVAELETALTPFAAVADAYDDSEDDDHEPYTDMGCDDRLRLTLSQHRAARTALSGAPAQAQQLHDLDKQCRDDVARALGLRPSQERGFAWSYLLASIKSCVKASEDTAQAQHSVPETINEEANSFLRIADAGQFKDNAAAVRTAAMIIRGLLHRPAIMKSIIRHRIGLTPEYEGQWHADLYGEDGEAQHHAEADTPDEAVRAVVALAAAPGKEGL
ncbi:hypothetical protein ACM73C_01955 [Pseudomonas aeruginosa]